ncbi:Mpv17 PMP22 domain containing protein [Pyrenophora teres f. maculata]|nr:Mpv17 PMP22 domain containing protein [Pyrenophora teres f. maculata]
MSMISQTLQGAVLSITSNVLAQAISSYQDSTPFALNYNQVLQFALFSILSNPPNIIWQGFLEDQFPTNVPSAAVASEKPASSKPPTKTSLSKTNVLIKFILDQTIGAVMNTLMFLAYMGYVNAQGKPGVDAMEVVKADCMNKLWPMMKDGYKFWPAISLISFLWIPVDKRIVFGCSVGVVWGIYLSLAVGA